MRTSSLLCYLLVLFFAIGASSHLYAQSKVPVALPRLQLFDQNGDPLAGGKLFTYAAGTTTPLATYTDATGVTANTNPVLADAGGYMSVYFTPGVAYKLQVQTSAGVNVGPAVDNVVLNPQDSMATLAGCSGDVTAGNATSDPGEPGAEILAATGCDELKQIRFRLGEITGQNWRKSTIVRRAISTGMTAVSVDNTVWTPTGTTSWYFRFRTPDGWDGSTMSFKILRRFLVAGGTAKMFWRYNRASDGTLTTQSGVGVIDFVHADGLAHQVNMDMTGLAITPGDTVLVEVTRLGDDAGDTNTGNVTLDGYWLEYTGVGGR